MLLHRFYVIRDPVRNRRMATWNLYVFVTILQRNLHCSIAIVNLHSHSHVVLAPFYHHELNFPSKTLPCNTQEIYSFLIGGETMENASS